jgi:hypothetical protein
MHEDNWIAEEPEKHLMPHIEAACNEADVPLALGGSQVLDDGACSSSFGGKATRAIAAGFAQPPTHLSAASPSLPRTFASSGTATLWSTTW